MWRLRDGETRRLKPGLVTSGPQEDELRLPRIAPTRLPEPADDDPTSRLIDSTIVNVVGAVSAVTTAMRRAGHAGAGGADDEGQHPGPAQVDAGQGGRHLVVAHGPPHPAVPADDEVGQQQQHEQGEDPAEVGGVLLAGQLPAQRPLDERLHALAGPGRPHPQALLTAQRLLEGQRQAGSPTASARVAPAR
jgi:hypothetical protein